jgi:hypothetical protein
MSLNVTTPSPQAFSCELARTKHGHEYSIYPIVGRKTTFVFSVTAKLGKRGVYGISQKATIWHKQPLRRVAAMIAVFDKLTAQLNGTLEGLQ